MDACCGSTVVWVYLYVSQESCDHAVKFQLLSYGTGT